MSSHQTNKDKPRSAKCRHFCFSFDTHNYCPTCRESGKGDDPCVTFESPCGVCAAFSEEQLIKITHRKRYVKKQKRDTTKDDELDLLGDEDVESFTGSQADLQSAADNLFTSPPRPPPLPFESLSLKTPAKSVPPTPGTALQQKIESKLEKSLGNTSNIQLQQQMGVFQDSMLEAFQSLRDEFSSFQKTSKQPEVEVDQTSASASKPGSFRPLIYLRVNILNLLPLLSGTRWDSLVMDKIQELNTDFAKIYITPKPSGAPMGKVPLPILKELEHQARQNISTLNFTAAFAKTSSSCNATLEKCQYSLKSTFKKVKSQIQKGANSEKAAKHRYEQACEYLDI